MRATEIDVLDFYQRGCRLSSQRKRPRPAFMGSDEFGQFCKHSITSPSPSTLKSIVIVVYNPFLFTFRSDGES